MSERIWKGMPDDKSETMQQDVKRMSKDMSGSEKEMPERILENM